MKETPDYGIGKLRLPENSDQVLVGDLNYNFSRIAGHTLGTFVLVGPNLYGEDVRARDVIATDRIANAFMCVNARFAETTAATMKLTGYTPPTGNRVMPIAETDTINTAFTKLMRYINLLEERVAALEQGSRRS